MFPVECVARGYLTGSGLLDYARDRRGLRHRRCPPASSTAAGCRSRSSPRPPRPTSATTTRTSPTTPSSPPSAPRRAATLRDLTLAVYARAEGIARERGIILADTKLEFGALDGRRHRRARRRGADPRLLALLAGRRLGSPGRAQPSYDKQIVRNWALSPESGWDRASGEAPPPLPPEVVERTRARYVEAYELLTGERVVAVRAPVRFEVSCEVAYDYLVDPANRAAVAVEPQGRRRRRRRDGVVGQSWTDVTTPASARAWSSPTPTGRTAGPSAAPGAASPRPSR